MFITAFIINYAKKRINNNLLDVASSPFDLLPSVCQIFIREVFGFATPDVYFLGSLLGLLLHHIQEEGSGWRHRFFLVLPELASKVLSLQQLLVPFEVFGVEVACAPVGKLNFLPHSPQAFFCLFHKFLDLLLVLQLEKLLLDSLLHVLLVLVLTLFFFQLCRWGVVKVGEGESDEV